MTNIVITWIDKELGIIKTEESVIAPEILAWAKNFLSTITPAIKQAAEDAVISAVTVPGTGAVKAAAAFGTAVADLSSKGIPIIENDLKAAIQIAYNALPAAVTENTAATDVVTAASDEVSTLATDAQSLISSSVV